MKIEVTPMQRELAERYKKLLSTCKRKGINIHELAGSEYDDLLLKLLQNAMLVWMADNWRWKK
jgi:hypothetical protein